VNIRRSWGESDNILVAETDEELLTFDVADETLERAAPIVGGQPL
jgi:hypothetical protein